MKRSLTHAAGVALTVLATGVVSCGNLITADVRGDTAFSLNERGELMVHVDTCDYAAVEIDIVAGRENLQGSEVNPTLGTVVTDQPQQGRFAVNMLAPKSPWRVEQPLEPRESPDLLIISSVITGGSVAGKDEAIPQVSATMSEIAALAPGEVLINEWVGGEELIRNVAIAEADFSASCE
ncbi:hypothetical protein HMPREF0290_1982 [Corynebacterium efficiens YS-314]|uniref:Uncharacterized protein n=1 Tax=Corynebacterium efficiens (strain DSM 44549 / YS-314 / AJ 12310 / JCM 11189 / NBRC 100395) TaxID=196164 RepID=Q8FP37_COREF|nr:hypothetical protein [Corynebacterium efficiens]EEW49390.1 hypothetical protein HMPREF0290_1982 [Corynebacterium efficiens YS-314]BAC18762.1 hypothetical protein [Corynebacterium efficiens YS-314]